MDKILGVFTTIFVGVPLTIVCLIISWWFDKEGQDDKDTVYKSEDK